MPAIFDAVVAAIAAIMERDDKDLDAFTQTGVPTVLAVERQMGEGANITAQVRDDAFAAWKARSEREPSPAEPAPTEAPSAGAIEGTEIVAEIITEPEGVVAGLAEAEAEASGSFSDAAGDLEGGPPDEAQEAVAGFDAVRFQRVMPWAAGAAWEAVRHLRQRETGDRYVMQEWDYANSDDRQKLLRALADPESPALAAIDAIDDRIFALAAILLDTVRD